MLPHGLILVIIALILMFAIPAAPAFVLLFRILAYILIGTGVVMLVIIPLFHYIRRNT